MAGILSVPVQPGELAQGSLALEYKIQKCKNASLAPPVRPSYSFT